MPLPCPELQLELVDAMIDVLWRLSTELLKMQLYVKHGQQPAAHGEIEALAPSARAEVKARVVHGEQDDDASRLQLIEHVQSGGPKKPAKSRYMMWFTQRRDRRKSSVGAVSSAASEQHKQGKLSRMSTSSLLGGRKQSGAVLS